MKKTQTSVLLGHRKNPLRKNINKHHTYSMVKDHCSGKSQTTAIAGIQQKVTQVKSKATVVPL
jgi:hypothetical protein